MMPIRVVPFGEIPEPLLEHLLDEIEEGIRHLVGPVSLESERDLPRGASDAKRGRLNAGDVLAKLRRRAGRQQVRLLGVTDRPLAGDREQERYGRASSPGKAALITLHEFEPNRPDYEITERFLERSTKEALHQIGHTLGLKHCGRTNCVMQRSTSLAELDRKSKRFCTSCSGHLDGSSGAG